MKATEDGEDNLRSVSFPGGLIEISPTRLTETRQINKDHRISTALAQRISQFDPTRLNKENSPTDMGCLLGPTSKCAESMQKEYTRLMFTLQRQDVPCMGNTITANELTSMHSYH